MATVTATIPAGQTLSNAVDLGTLQLVAVIPPADWTPAVLSFQMSADNVDFHNLAHARSTDLFTIPCVSGYWIPFSTQDFPHWVFLKLRSGHPFAPIVQAADRVFTLVMT
jgi:hypothetical protein